MVVVEAAAQLLPDLASSAPNGFVQGGELRLDGQARAKATLALAAGELAGEAFGEIGQLDGVEKLLDAGANLRFRRPVASFADPEAEGDILEDVEMLEEGVVLKDEARPALIGALQGDIAIAEEDLPVLGELEPGDDP